MLGLSLFALLISYQLIILWGDFGITVVGGVVHQRAYSLPFHGLICGLALCWLLYLQRLRPVGLLPLSLRAQIPHQRWLAITLAASGGFIVLQLLLLQTLGFPWPGLALVLCALVALSLAAFMEELVYRGGLFYSLSQRCTWRGTVAIQALIFGGHHLINLTSGYPAPYVVAQLLGTVGVGLALGCLRLRSVSLWPCILLHIWFNGYVFVNELIRDRASWRGDSSATNTDTATAAAPPLLGEADTLLLSQSFLLFVGLLIFWRTPGPIRQSYPQNL